MGDGRWEREGEREMDVVGDEDLLVLSEMVRINSA